MYTYIYIYTYIYYIILYHTRPKMSDNFMLAPRNPVHDLLIGTAIKVSTLRLATYLALAVELHP